MKVLEDIANIGLKYFIYIPPITSGVNDPPQNIHLTCCYQERTKWTSLAMDYKFSTTWCDPYGRNNVSHFFYTRVTSTPCDATFVASSGAR